MVSKILSFKELICLRFLGVLQTLIYQIKMFFPQQLAILAIARGFIQLILELQQLIKLVEHFMQEVRFKLEEQLKI